MSVVRRVLCLLVAAPLAGGQDADLDPSLPSYRPVAGVIGVIRSHSTAAISDLMALWRAGFEDTYPDVRIELDDGPLDGVPGGACTFGPRVNVLGVPTAKRFKSRFGYAAMEIPVCLYVLGAFVNKDHPYERLPIEDVEASFSCVFNDQTWGDLGLGGVWSQRPVRPYAPRHHASALLGELPFGPVKVFAFKDSVTRCATDAAVVTSVAEDALGLGLASIGCRTDKVRALAIAPKGSSDFVAATADNARNGSYPLAATFYLILNHDPKGEFELDPLRREFLRYVLSKEGQEAVIKAGFVALSAEQAAQALAQFGLRPTGDGAWGEMLSRLRARELTPMRMARIEGEVRRIGDQPSQEQLVGLSNLLSITSLMSSIVVTTDEKGAGIKCRLVGQPKAELTIDPAKGGERTVPLGLYHIWTERDGKPTSPRGALFQVVRERERLRIYEDVPGPDR